VRSDLDAFKGVKDVFGGTVNDVVLAVTAGAIRHWMHARGLKTEGTDLRVSLTRLPNTFKGKLIAALIPIAGPGALGRQFQSVLRRAESR